MHSFALASLLLSAAWADDTFAVTSPVVDGGITSQHVFAGFGCEGQNQSPAIRWSGAPDGTRSFALLVHDPDAPTGGAGWWHWSVYDIPATATGLPGGVTAAAGLPDGARQGPTDFGRPGWGGPCPPAGHGDHRYIFSLYALGVAKLEVPDGASASLIGFLVNQQALGTASFQVKYAR
jgi:Raf kinase inhibitor-like YbhB/YbcL family protein